MSAIGVSISDIIKVSSIFIKCCEACSKDGSKAQYEDTISSHKCLIETLKRNREDLVSRSEDANAAFEIENCDSTIAMLEQQLARLEKEYGRGFADKRSLSRRMLKSWTAVHWAFRDPDKVRNQAISNSICIDASLLSSIRFLSKSLEDAQKAQAVTLTKIETEIGLSRKERKSADDEIVHLLRRMRKEQSLTKVDLIQAMSSVMKDIQRPEIPAFVGKLLALRTLIFDTDKPCLAFPINDVFLYGQQIEGLPIFRGCPSLRSKSSCVCMGKRCKVGYGHCTVHKNCSWCLQKKKHALKMDHATVVVLSDVSQSRSLVQFFANDEIAEACLHRLRKRQRFLNWDALSNYYKRWGVSACGNSIEIALRLKLHNASLLRYLLQLELNTKIRMVRSKEPPFTDESLFCGWHAEPSTDITIRFVMQLQGVISQLSFQQCEELKSQLCRMHTQRNLLVYDEVPKVQPNYSTVLQTVAKRKKLFCLASGLVHYLDSQGKLRYGVEYQVAPRIEDLTTGMAVRSDEPYCPLPSQKADSDAQMRRAWLKSLREAVIRGNYGSESGPIEIGHGYTLRRDMPFATLNTRSATRNVKKKKVVRTQDDMPLLIERRKEVDQELWISTLRRPHFQSRRFSSVTKRAEVPDDYWRPISEWSTVLIYHFELKFSRRLRWDTQNVCPENLFGESC